MRKEYIKIGIALLVMMGIAIPLSMHREKEIAKLVAEDLSKKFISVDLDQVDRIQVINKKGEVLLQRRSKDASGKYDDEFNARSFEYKDTPEWFVAKPNRILADPSLMEGFLSQIRGITYDKVIQDTKERLKDYNLDPANISFRFFLKDQSEPKLSLDMGSENPANTGFYFSASDKPGIYLGERVLQPFAEQDVDTWFEKRILGIPNSNDLEHIQIQHVDSSSQTFELTKNKEEWILGPVSENLAADVAQINAYVAEVDSTRAIQILNDESLVKKGKIVGSVTLKFKSVNEPVTYSIFKDPKDPRMAYMQRSDMKNIFSIGMNPNMLPAFSDLVKRTLMNKSLTRITSMKIVRPSGEIDLANENQVWKIQKPYQDEANPRRLDSILKVLEEFKPGTYLPKKILNEKNRVVKFEYIFENTIKEAVSFFDEGKKYFVQSEGPTKTRIFSISQIPSEIFEHLSHLRNDDLVPVSDEHVKRIVFTKGKGKVEIEQNEEKQQWFLKFLEGVPSTVNMRWKEELTPEELFDRTADMYLVDFLAQVDPNAKFDTATLEIFSDQNIQYTWKFGEKKGQLIQVYSPERKVAGLMAWSKYQDLATFLEEPKKSDKRKP